MSRSISPPTQPPGSALIVGACSAIAQAIAIRLSAQGYSLLLLARDESRLQNVLATLSARGAGVLETYALDMCDYARASDVLREIHSRFPDIRLAVICHGIMRSNDECSADFEQFRNSVETNFTSAVFWMTRTFSLLKSAGNAEMVVISSISGDRGRAKNYFYGSTKSALSTFAEGMRAATAGSGVNILCVKPGPVDTPMSSGIRAKGRLWAQPEQVASVVSGALGKGRGCVYAPGYWRCVMWVIRNLPGALLARLGL